MSRLPEEAVVSEPFGGDAYFCSDPRPGVYRDGEGDIGVAAGTGLTDGALPGAPCFFTGISRPHIGHLLAPSGNF